MLVDLETSPQTSKSCYKLTWFTIMDLLDEATRFEESEYYLQASGGKIHKIEARVESGVYKITANGFKLKEVRSMGEAWTILKDSLGYKSGA